LLSLTLSVLLVISENTLGNQTVFESLPYLCQFFNTLAAGLQIYRTWKSGKTSNISVDLPTA